jgi:Amt family ammonium transporter
LGGAVLLAPAAHAAPTKIDTGDTAWMLTATALVMFMTPGLALFYGGMVRRKNVLGTMMHSLMALGLISLQWVLLGYTLAFHRGNLAIGGLGWLGLHGVGGTPDPVGYAPSIPHGVFMAFQLMFAIITPALLFGGVAERMKFSAYALFILLWATFIYDPLAHWVWGSGGLLGPGGIFRALGLGGQTHALDFAGGLVVHVSSGLSALVCALMIGRRRNYPREPMVPHNLPLAALGAGMLWFGWFGFNAGSALAANGLAAMALVNTNTGAAAGVMGWVIAEWLKGGKPTALGAISGAVAGLVVITPACGFVEPWAAVLMGLAAGALCYAAVNLKARLGYDDTLDAFGVHGVGGSLGALLTGVFATTSVNPAGANGLLYGNPSQFVAQLISVIVTYLFVGVACFGLLKLTDALVGLRVSDEAELVGIDLAEHGESGYNLEDIPMGHGAPAHPAPAVHAQEAAASGHPAPPVQDQLSSEPAA